MSGALCPVGSDGQKCLISTLPCDTNSLVLARLRVICLEQVVQGEILCLGAGGTEDHLWSRMPAAGW